MRWFMALLARGPAKKHDHATELDETRSFFGVCRYNCRINCGNHLLLNLRFAMSSRFIENFM